MGYNPRGHKESDMTKQLNSLAPEYLKFTYMAHIVFLLDISALDHYWLNEPVDLE